MALFTAAAAAAPYIGTTVLGALGLGSLFGGKKKKQQEIYDPYAEIRPLLRQYATEGFPEWQQQWQQPWKEEIMPGIQETYRAKRGMGAASTPEIAALGQAGRGLMSEMSTRDLMGRLQALGMYAQAAPTVGIPAQEPSMLQNLLGFGAPMLGGYMQQQQMQPLIDALLGRGAAGGVAPEFSPYGGQQYDPFGGLGLGQGLGQFGGVE